MKGFTEFVKTTLIGGILVLVPIYLAVLLLAKALAAGGALMAPLANQLPVAVHFRDLAALLLVLVACFLAGLMVRTGPGKRGIQALEQRILGKIPGYSMIRGLVHRVGGEEQGALFAPALVEIEEALVPAVIVEELPDGQFTVLVPSVPTPAAGALYVLPAARVHRVNVPIAQMFRVYARWGEGTGALLKAMEKPIVPARPTV